MAHNIEKIAFLGSRADVWHHIGSEMTSGMSLESWAQEAGLNWAAVKVPALADCSSLGQGLQAMKNRSFVVRSDTAAPLGYVGGEDDTRGYQIVQPLEVLDWFQRYISVDDRFELDTAMSLKGGTLIAVTAKFNGSLSVLGEDHNARLLMTTSFDGSASTINQMTMTRVVCNNTLRMSIGDQYNSALIRVPHHAQFDAEAVRAQLGLVDEQWSGFIAEIQKLAKVKIGRNEAIDIIAQQLKDEWLTEDAAEMTREQMLEANTLLRRVIALHDGEGLGADYKSAKGTAWGLLNAVTQYCDHEAGAKTGDKSRAFERTHLGDRADFKVQVANRLLELA